MTFPKANWSLIRERHTGAVLVGSHSLSGCSQRAYHFTRWQKLTETFLAAVAIVSDGLLHVYSATVMIC